MASAFGPLGLPMTARTFTQGTDVEDDPTDETIPAVVIWAPIDESGIEPDSTVHFLWQAWPGAESQTHVQLQIASDGSRSANGSGQFITPKVDTEWRALDNVGHGFTGTAFGCLEIYGAEWGLDQNATYFWLVRVRDARVRSEWQSNPGNFTTRSRLTSTSWAAAQ